MFTVINLKYAGYLQLAKMSSHFNVIDIEKVHIMISANDVVTQL